MKKMLINEVIDMSYLNADLQKVNYQIDMKVNMEQSIFQRIFDIISNSDLYKKQFFISSFQHNIYHIQRVMLFSQIIAQNECISEKDLKLLLLAAALHDSGKIRDRKDFEHGKNSAKIAKRYLLNNISSISEEEIKIIQIAIEYHTVQEKEKGKLNIVELEKLCKNYNISMKNLERIKIISSILKDADALDRTRFNKQNCLDVDTLRTNTAKNELLINFVKNLNQQFAIAILNSNYRYDYLTDNDAIKTLSVVRKKFFEDNNGVEKNDSEEEQNMDFFMEQNPNEKYGAKPPIYGKIFKDIISGNISISVLEELREALTELNAIPNEEYMKKFESYINLIDVDSKQKDLIYSNILLRKKNINVVLEVLKIKLDEKTQNDEVEL